VFERCSRQQRVVVNVRDVVLLRHTNTHLFIYHRNNQRETTKGKVEHNESITLCATRELKEESNLTVSSSHMESSYVGHLYFTFQDKRQAMVVHLFALNLDLIDSCGDVKGCEEITPSWFKINDIPYRNMFADDIFWLPMVIEHVLSSASSKTEDFTVPKFNQYYHYKAGGDKVNEIDFYHIEMISTTIEDCNKERIRFMSDRAFLGNLGMNPIHFLTAGVFIELGDGNSKQVNQNDEEFFDSSTDIIRDTNTQHFSDTSFRNPISKPKPTPPSIKKLCSNPNKIDRKLNPKPLTLENKLFHAIHKDCSLSVQEFKESFAFANSVLSTFGKKSISVVIDVAGGHGALSSLFLILDRNIECAVVIDPAYCESGVKGTIIHMFANLFYKR